MGLSLFDKDNSGGFPKPENSTSFSFPISGDDQVNDSPDPFEQDKNYFSNDAVSNSDRYVFVSQGPHAYWNYKHGPLGRAKKENPDKFETDIFKFGSLYHTYILEPDTYDDKYACFGGKKPSSSNMGKFCEEVANGIAVEMAYQNNYSIKGKKPAAIREAAYQLYEDLCGYIEYLQTSRNKKPVTSEEELQIERMGFIYEQHPKVESLKYIASRETSIVIIEEPGFWYDEEWGIECRFKPDWVIIDTVNKIIYHNDLKTTKNSSPLSFPSDGIKGYGYDEQVVFYRRGLLMSDLVTSKLEKIGHNITEYVIISSIIACCKMEPFATNVFEFTDEDLIIPTINVTKSMKEISLYTNEGIEEGNWFDYVHDPKASKEGVYKLSDLR